MITKKVRKMFDVDNTNLFGNIYDNSSSVEVKILLMKKIIL